MKKDGWTIRTHPVRFIVMLVLSVLIGWVGGWLTNTVVDHAYSGAGVTCGCGGRGIFSGL